MVTMGNGSGVCGYNGEWEWGVVTMGNGSGVWLQWGTEVECGVTMGNGSGACGYNGEHGSGVWGYNGECKWALWLQWGIGVGCMVTMGTLNKLPVVSASIYKLTKYLVTVFSH